MTANIQTATLAGTDAIDYWLLDACKRGTSVIEDESTIDGDGDVYLVAGSSNRWYVGATFTDGPDTIFVKVAGPVLEEAAREALYANSARWADEHFGSSEAFADYVDAEVDRLKDERLIARYEKA